MNFITTYYTYKSFDTMRRAPMKIGVLYGGVSKEREVSISSSKGIIEALKRNGHEVIPIDFNPQQLEDVINLEVDLIYIALHGKHGEDGCVQGLLDMVGIPYIGSGVLASALAMDKTKAKEMFDRADIPTAKGQRYRVNESSDLSEISQDINSKFTPPFVIKPNREGSTLGLTIVQKASEISEAVGKAMQSDDSILVEQFIKGIELTVPVIGEIGEEKALPIIEIIPKNELYDFESKYAEGGSEHIIPARIDDALTLRIQEFAVLAHQVLGCETYSRADFILTEDNTPYILEVNTLPGMTPTSLFPDAAQTVGISYDQMIETFIELTKNK